MASAARLARLHNFVKEDLDALAVEPTVEVEAISDDDDSGGVTLGHSPTSQLSARSVAEAPASTTSPPIALKQEPIMNHEKNTERRFVWHHNMPSAYNLGSRPKRTAVPSAKVPHVDLKTGEIARIKYFTPIVALSKYPYKFCHKDYMQDIASEFFHAGKFWDREWDLYYVWDLDETRPLVLVGEPQVEQLLREINAALDLNLRITSQQRDDGLVDRFPDHPRCLPRYLGRMHSKDEYDTMVSNVPSVRSETTNGSVPRPLDGGTLEQFKQKMDAMIELNKKQSKAAKEKKMKGRMAKQKTLSDQFKRAQRYLGLRPCAKDDLQVDRAPSIDESLPTAFAFDRSVVFICVDIEAYEKSHCTITEVGIATLDTLDLIDVAPGTNGENWRSKIHARHFRIQENAHLVNELYVAGCPNRFDWGKSEFVAAKDAPARIAECFQSPFAAPMNPNADAKPNDFNTAGLRNLVLLGHDTQSDIKYLQQLGFDPLVLPNLLETQDTAVLFRVWKREQNPTKLGKVLYEFDIPGFNLHNAGNDAVFTVQAMLGICVKEAAVRGTVELKEFREEQKATKLAEAQAEAERQIEILEILDADWNDHELDGDGGLPMPPKGVPIPTSPKNRSA